MSSHGVWTHEELLRDLWVCKPFSDQPDDFQFPLAQAHAQTIGIHNVQGFQVNALLANGLEDLPTKKTCGLRAFLSPPLQSLEGRSPF